MDTLSGSVSSLKIPTAAATTLRHKSHQLHHHFNHHQHPAGHLIISSKSPNNKTTPAFTHNHNINNLSTSNNQLPFLNNASSSSASCSSSSPVVKQSGCSKAELEFHHKKASTGYAVALLDAARAQNVLELAKKDVKKLSKWLSNEQLMSCIVEQKEKGEILKEIMKKGKFNYKHLGKLVKLLVEKNKVEMVKDVLLEFQRMYDELMTSSNDHQVVLIPAAGMKMEDNQILGIAKITGAHKVMVFTQLQLITC